MGSRTTPLGGRIARLFGLAAGETAAGMPAGASHPSSSVLRSTLALGVVLIAFILGAIALIEQGVRRNVIADLSAMENSRVALTERILMGSLRDLPADLQFLADAAPVVRLLNQQDEAAAEVVGRFFSDFARHRRTYDRIRLLDPDGRELVRVDGHDGHPRVVPPNPVADETTRQDLAELAKLPPGAIYLSPIEVHVELGGPRQTPKPMMRLAISVLGTASDRRGVVVLNYLPRDLLNIFDRLMARSAGTPILLNDRGYWLRGSAINAPASLFNRSLSFAQVQPAAWKAMQIGPRGQLLDEDGLLSFRWLDPTAEIGSVAGGQKGAEPGNAVLRQERWVIATIVDPQALYRAVDTASAGHRRLYLVFGAAVIALFAVAMALRAREQRAYAKLTQSMQLLAGNEKRLRDFADAASDWFWETGPDLRFTWFSERHDAVLGMSSRCLIGRRREELAAEPTDTPKWQAYLETVDRRKPFRNFIYAVPAPDRIRHLRISGTPRFDDGGTFLGYRGAAADITPEVEAAAAAARSEARHRVILASTSAAIGVCDPAGRWIDFNPAWPRLLGYDDAVFAATPATDMFPPDDRRLVLHHTALLFRGEADVARLEHRMVRADGSHLWIEASLSAMRGQDGRVEGIIVIAHDISQRKSAEAKLTQALEELQAVMDAVPAAILIAHDRDGRYITGNLAAYRMFQVPQGTNLSMTAPPEERLSYYQVKLIGAKVETDKLPIQFVANSGIEITGIEEEIEFKNKERLFLYGTVRPLFDAEGHPRGAVAGFVDITQRRLAEQELIEVRDRLSDAQRIAHLGHWIWDPSTGKGSWSDEAYRLFDEPVGGELPRGKRFLAKFHPDDQELARQALPEFIAGHGPHRIEYRLIRKDGTIRWLNLCGEAERDATGRLLRIVGTVQDISERKASEAAIHRSEARFRGIFAHAPVGIGLVDETGRYIDCNDAWCRMLGYRREELLGLTSHDVTDPEDRTATAGHLERIVRGDADSFRVEKRFRRKDGSIVWGDLTVSTLRDPSGRFEAGLGIIIDISESRRAREALLRQSQFLQSVLDAVPIPLFLKDQGGRYKMLNAAFARFFGRPTEALIGQTTADISQSDFARRAAETDRHVLQTGESVSYEGRVAVANGGAHDTIIYKSIFRDADGTVGGIIGGLLDVTDSKRVEAALRASEQRLSQIIRTSPAVTYTCVPFGEVFRASFLSDNVTAMLGHDARAFVEDPAFWWEHVHPDDLPRLRVEFPAMIERGSDVIEYRFRHRDGSWRWVRDAVNVVRDKDGQPSELVGSWLDITARKEAENRLNEAHELLRSVIEALPNPVFIKDREHRWVILNQASCELMGQPAATLIGKSDHDFFPAEEARVFWERDNLAFQSDRPIENEEGLTDASGRQRWILTRKSAFSLPNGERYLVGVITDISDRKEVEQTLDRALVQAEAANRAKSAFLATMSHEIRTPLNGIIGMTGLLLDTVLDGDQRSMANIIRASGETLLTLINDILDFSKIEAGKVQLEESSFEIRPLVEGVVEMLAPRALEKQLDMVADIDRRVPPGVFGDPNRLRQILTNLIGNAVKFTDRGGVEVAVTLQTLEESRVALRFEVCDTGIGIPDDRLSLLFRDFSQVDDSPSRRFGGSGLGLAISKRLCLLMHGDIGVTSTPGKGSAFWFELPFGLPAVGEVPALPAAPALPPAWVLIFEPSPISGAWLERQLVDLGMSVLRLSEITAALTRCEEETWQMALVAEEADVDGRLRMALAAAPEPPRVIVIVRSASLGHRARAAARGAPVLAKPLRRSQLVEVLATSFGVERSRSLPTTIADGADPAEEAQRCLRILVAEDNPVNQEVTRRLLESRGHRADMVGNGLEAIEAARSFVYDIILMDLQMPDLDGLTATRAIRALGGWGASVPIIAMTAKVVAGSAEECRAAGMDDYVSKPISPRHLFGALAKWSRLRARNGAA